MHFHTGTMGFSYPDWQRVFYPEGTRPADYLATYATAFDSLELDTTFHAAPSPDRVQKWTDAVPAGFTFCVKTPKAITHDAPIAFGIPAMRSFLRSLTPMRAANKLGCVLIQFAPSFQAFEFDNLQTFLKELPTDLRFAVEFRHPSWETKRTADLLAHYQICWATGDYGVDPFPIHPTAPFAYVRLIGVHEQFGKHDRERIDMTDRLSWWLEQLDSLADRISTSYLFVNNDYAGHSPATIRRLRKLLNLPTQTPAPIHPPTSLF
ncbi:MAG TPA: DUF72 domain-containing protein [Phycisphaerae bacterium]|nr:DUF72 domain-containing protein [Phycisphaerae bacterium]